MQINAFAHLHTTSLECYQAQQQKPFDILWSVTFIMYDVRDIELSCSWAAMNERDIHSWQHYDI